MAKKHAAVMVGTATPADSTATATETETAPHTTTKKPAADKGPANAREYFKAVARPMNVSATIEDVCGVLEHFGVVDLPEGFARRG